jgi:hypothetical protein
VDFYNEPDFWFDVSFFHDIYSKPVIIGMSKCSQVVNNELQALTLSEEALYDGEACEHCLCSVPEYLVRCKLCVSRFCYRRISYDESSNAELDQSGEIQPTDQPGEEDPFEMEEACILLNHYAADGARPPLEQARSEFVCPDCWSHDLHGFYPVSPLQTVVE